jgi:methyl-accepting chemotaxis protein
MASNLQGLSDRLQTAPNNGPDPVVDRLDEVIGQAKDIKKLLSASGSGAGKETQLEKIKETTNPFSVTTVDGEKAAKILSAATENISKDLEQYTDEERKMLTELVKEIGKLTEKNLEGFNKGIKEVLALAKKGQTVAEASGNTGAATRFANAGKAAKEQYFQANDMGLKGKEDTFRNRLKRAVSGKDTTTGTAIPKGFVKTQLEGAKRVFTGRPGDLRYDLFTSDKKKRAEARDSMGVAQEAEKLTDLTTEQKKLLADRGIAPASDKDISYRRDGKPVSKDTINAELQKDYDEKKSASVILPDKPTTGAVAAGIESNVAQPTSELQEDSAGMSESPVVDAIQENTKKLDEISDTFKEANELLSVIKDTIEKIAQSIESSGGSDGPDGGGGPVIDIDLPSRRNRGGNIPNAPDGSKQSRSERARSQPRDAKGRFVKKTPAVSPGRTPGKGRGLLGALALGAGAIGMGSMIAGNDNDGGENLAGNNATNMAANTAMTAAELAPAPGNATKAAEKGATGATKAGEKGVVKAGEKGVVKAGEKVAAKGVAKVGAKAVGKSLLKKIPGVGLVAGGLFAAQRAMQGDWTGAGLELASGAAGTIPGVGTAASVGLDAALAARDMGAFGGTPETRAADGAQSEQAPKAAAQPKQPAVQGKPGGGIFSKAAGFVKRNPLMMAAGGLGLAAVGAKTAYDYMSGGGEETKVQSGQNPDSGILEKGSEQAKDQMKVNVPPPTIINQGGGGGGGASESTTVPNAKTYVRDDESSWMRFALKRAMA